jgi:rod shape-determining protein MreC
MTGGRFHLITLGTVVLGLTLFFTDLSRFSYVRAVALAFNTVISPVLNLKEKILTETEEKIDVYLRTVEVKKENRMLREKIQSLLLREKELEACERELEALRNLLKVARGFSRLDYTLSRVVYYDPSGFDLFLIIEGGRDRNFKERDLVVSRREVVGFVEAVFGSTSRVITPLNARFSSTVVVEGRKKRYIYRGGYPLGDLLHVKVEDPVKEGDKVFLVDAEGRIPPFLLGVVDQVRRGKDPFFKEVKVRPLVDPREVEFLFVIRR